MLSAMSASIISLRLINLAPHSMHRWTDRSEEGVEIKLGAEQNIGRQELMEGLRSRFETRMWKHVTQGEATGGLELGTNSGLSRLRNASNGS